MAAIYEKALKRKDFSGAVETERQKDDDEKDVAYADGSKAGADVGIIVNLMANDANRVKLLYYTIS